MPLRTDWKACQAMAWHPIDEFLNACIDIFNKFSIDPLLDCRVQLMAEILKINQQTLQIVPMISAAAGQLMVWAENVVKYWEVFRKEN